MNQDSAKPVPVALLRQPDYQRESLKQGIYRLLEKASLAIRPGMSVLVKPNLLTARPLACASPELVALACSWLLEQGARVRVADSPGFGQAGNVARSIGLANALAPLGLRVESLGSALLPAALCPKSLRLALPLDREEGIAFPVARAALEADLILSVARVKAHSQMRLTLCVKNCFGCVPGMAKALIHSREGRDPEFFADCLAALWAALPPVAGLLDGVIAMQTTGPIKGDPYPLGLIGASASAVALDQSILAILGLAPEEVPLSAALARRGAAEACVSYPLETPQAFSASGFQIPRHLTHTSFAPLRLAKSCLRRVFAASRI